MFLDEGLSHGPSDHTDCCGSECKPFHLGACSLNSPRFILVDSGSNVCHAWTFLLLEYGSLYISGLEHRSGHFFVS